MLTVKNYRYLATLGHFEKVAAENGEKPKSGKTVTQPPYWQFTTFTSKYLFLRVENIKNWWKISYSAMTGFQNPRWLPNMANRK